MEQPELSRMLVKWPESSCIVGETVKRGKTRCISTWCIATLWPRNTSLKHLPESNKNIYKKTCTRIFRATFFMNSGNWEKATHGKIVIQGIPLSYKKEETTHAWQHVCVLSHFSHFQLCNILNCSLPDSSVHGILQARMLEWVAMPSSLPNPGIEPVSPADPVLQADSLPLIHWESPKTTWMNDFQIHYTKWKKPHTRVH